MGFFLESLGTLDIGSEKRENLVRLNFNYKFSRNPADNLPLAAIVAQKNE